MTHIIEDCGVGNSTPLCYEWDNNGSTEKVTAYAKLDKQSNFVEWVVLEGVSPPDLSIPSILKQCDILAADCECGERPKAEGDYYSIEEQGITIPAHLTINETGLPKPVPSGTTLTHNIGDREIVATYNNPQALQSSGSYLINYNYTPIYNYMSDTVFPVSPKVVINMEMWEDVIGAEHYYDIDFTEGDFTDLTLAITDIEETSVRIEFYDFNGDKLIASNTNVDIKYRKADGTISPTNELPNAFFDNDNIRILRSVSTISNDDGTVLFLSSNLVSNLGKIRFVQIQETAKNVSYGDGIEILLSTKNLYTNEFGKLLLGGCKSDGSAIVTGDTLHLKVFKKPKFGMFSQVSSGSVLWGDTAALESILSTSGIIDGTSTWANGVYEGGTYDSDSEYKIELSVEQSSLPGVLSYIKTIKF